jgi:hypothetical protein
MTAALPIHSPAQWNDRALDLARAHHLDGTATYLGIYTTSNGQPVCWHVPSRDRTSRFTVEYDPTTQRIRCHCQAAHYGRPCAHAGAVVHALRMRQRAFSTTEREATMRYQERWGQIEAPAPTVKTLRCDYCSRERPASEIAVAEDEYATVYYCAKGCEDA